MSEMREMAVDSTETLPTSIPSGSLDDPGSVERALEAVSVAKHFRGVKALDDVSLRVLQGEIVGLIGPNGSGKTTLLNVLSGVYRPSSGVVLCSGRNVVGRKPHVIAKIGMGRTYQNIRLFAHLTVRDNVEIGSTSGRAVAGVDHRADVDRLLEWFGLGDVSEQQALNLPYGAQRRVEIARALAGRPLFLLLDEPAAGMNEAESDLLLETIVGVRADFGCGILIVDHDLRLIMRLCERIHVLAEGRTLAEGTPQQVRNNSQVIDVFLGDALKDE